MSLGQSTVSLYAKYACTWRGVRLYLERSANSSMAGNKKIPRTPPAFEGFVVVIIGISLLIIAVAIESGFDNVYFTKIFWPFTT